MQEIPVPARLFYYRFLFLFFYFLHFGSCSRKKRGPSRNVELPKTTKKKEQNNSFVRAGCANDRFSFASVPSRFDIPSLFLLPHRNGKYFRRFHRFCELLIRHRGDSKMQGHWPNNTRENNFPLKMGFTFTGVQIYFFSP